MIKRSKSFSQQKMEKNNNRMRKTNKFQMKISKIHNLSRKNWFFICTYTGWCVFLCFSYYGIESFKMGIWGGWRSDENLKNFGKAKQNHERGIMYHQCMMMVLTIGTRLIKLIPKAWVMKWHRKLYIHI